MAQSSESPYKNTNTKSVSKTLAILSTFNETTPMQRTSDIAMKLQMNISTVSRHLNTLLDMGFLERDDATGYYYLGIEIIALAGAALQNNAVFRHAYPELHQTSYKFGVHSHMGVLRNQDIVHLISVGCKSSMELIIPMGHRHPVFCSAMGRAMLAYMPQEKVLDILDDCDLKQYTAATKTDRKVILQELQRVRQKGYCIVLDELVECIGSIAAPVFDRTRNAVAAVSVSASSYSLSQPERERELSKAVMSIASTISGKLGYYPK